MEGYKLKGNGEVCFRCRMPLMLRNQHQQQQEEEESRHDIEEVSGEENNKSNGGEVCVVCNEECVSVRDFERKIVMFSELHCAKLKIDESQENEGDEENGRDETVEQLPQNDINIVTEEDFLTLMDDVKIISDQDGDGIAVDNIETAFRRRCKTCAMDIPINDDIQYDAGGEVTTFAHETPYGDECQFCHVAKLGYTNDGEESDNEHENALHVDIDDMETVTSDVKSLANIDLGLYKEEMEGLLENEDELNNKGESEQVEVADTMEMKVDVEAGDTRLKPPLEVILINDEDKDVCNKKSVKPPWEVILISDKICVAVTKKMGVKQEEEEVVEEIEIVETLEIELQPNQSSMLAPVEQSQDNEEESSTLPVEQSQDKKDGSNDDNLVPKPNVSHDKSSFPAATLPPRDKSKVVKGLITKFWQQNLEEEQQHKSKTVSSDCSKADGIDDELQLEKRDLYEDLLACQVSKQTVHSLQHVFKGQRDPVEAVEPRRTSQSTRTFMMEPETSTNHGRIDPPCAMDPPTFEETSFMADSTLLNKRQEPNIYCSSVSTLDPPEESKCSSVVSSKDHTAKERMEEGHSLSSHTQHFNLSTSCDEVTRNDAISVLTVPTNPCDVSIRHDDEKSTMDEDGIRQQLTQLELKYFPNKKESTVFKRISPSRKVGYQSSKSALATISECSTYSTPTSTVSKQNHKSCLDNDSYNNQDQRRRTRLSPAAVARRRHYKEVLMARNKQSYLAKGIHGSLGPSSVVSYE